VSYVVLIDAVNACIIVYRCRKLAAHYCVEMSDYVDT